MRDLLDIVKEYKPSKAARAYPIYQEYARHFERIRHLKLNLLEIGVAMGGSLRTWQEYFPNAQIYGIDKNKKALFSDERIKTFHGRQDDLAFLEEVVKEINGSLDIVIDDGAHRYDQQLASLQVLLPHAELYYAIQDIHYDHFSIMPFLFNMVDEEDSIVSNIFVIRRMALLELKYE